MNNNEYLEHYGVPGMRWGKRKAVASLSDPRVIDLGPSDYRVIDSSSGYGSGRSSSGNSSYGSSSRSGNSNTNYGTNSRHDTGGGNSTPKSGGTKSSSNLKDIQSGLKAGKQISELGVKSMESNRKKANQKQLKKEAKEMSDDELKKIVSRLNMEEKYIQAMEKDGAGGGKTDLQKTLETVGTVVTYAGTALEIYSKIQEVRGK